MTASLPENSCSCDSGNSGNGSETVAPAAVIRVATAGGAIPPARSASMREAARRSRVLITI